MKKKLKGFTLIELIIVLAIFSVIMVGALSLVDPVSKINSRAKVNENSYAYVDNIQNYLQDSLEFSDHLWVYQGDFGSDDGQAYFSLAAKNFKNEYYKEIIAKKDGSTAVDYADINIRVMSILNKDTEIDGKTYPKGQILMRTVKYQSNAKLDDTDTPLDISAPEEMLNPAFFGDKYAYDYVVGSANLEGGKDGVGDPTGFLVLDTLANGGTDVAAKLTESNFAITIVAYQTKADRNGQVASLVNDNCRQYPTATHYTIANLPLFNIIDRHGASSKKYWVDGSHPKHIMNSAIAFHHDPATISMKQEDNIYIVYAMADEVTPHN